MVVCLINDILYFFQAIAKVSTFFFFRQLENLETRVSSDISSILQLLQHQVSAARNNRTQPGDQDQFNNHLYTSRSISQPLEVSQVKKKNDAQVMIVVIVFAKVIDVLLLGC